MDIYTLDENFLRRDLVDNFNSVVWTERFSTAGDVSLLVPLTQANITKIPEGTFLWTPGSKEVMLVESALMEKNQLKLTGPTIDKFLDERIIRVTASHEDKYWNLTLPPASMLAQMVYDICITGGAYTNAAAGIDGARQIIPGLSLGDIYSSATAVAVAIPYGPLYTALAQIADTYKLGFTMFLENASRSGYSLKFTVWAGRDLSATVKFSPNVDSLTNLKQIRSISGYRNVAYAFVSSNPDGLATTPGIAYADNEAATSVGFKRRALMVFADDITTDKTGGNPAVMLAMLQQRARDALANNNYTKVVDGEVVPQNQYQYGKDYRLGDIVELAGIGGQTQKARITEYIRTQDSTGERAYPTISIID